MLDQEFKLKYKTALIASLVLASVTWGFGFAIGYGKAFYVSQKAKDQLQGKLDEKDREILSANQELGKARTDLVSQAELNNSLKSSNDRLYQDANAYAKRYDLLLTKYNKLVADVTIIASTGKVPDGLKPEEVGAAPDARQCGSCYGRINFGTYATCQWADYGGINLGTGKPKLNLNMKVRVDSVRLNQRPENGLLETELSRVFITDPEGNVITEAPIDPRSSLAIINPTDLRTTRIQDKRIVVYGTVDTKRYGLGLFYQPVGKLYFYGAGVSRDLTGREIIPGVVFGWQIR